MFVLSSPPAGWLSIVITVLKLLTIGLIHLVNGAAFDYVPIEFIWMDYHFRNQGGARENSHGTCPSLQEQSISLSSVFKNLSTIGLFISS